MNKELAHSFNIKLNEEISEKLKNEQEKLKNLGFDEKRFYDSSPHLAIVTKFMGENETDQFVEALKNEFDDEKVFELEFSDFRLSNGGDYIFLHLSEYSEQKLIDMHNTVMQSTKNIGLEVQMDKKFRRFDYDPHISIIKLLPEEIAKALESIKTNFIGVKMKVSNLEITRQTDDGKGFSNFPVIEVINLKG